MTLQQLHYAITISEAGSLNRAAELLYVAQPSLSSALQELERELGITIFHRSGRGVTLTNDGVEFISYARQLYTQYENILEKYGQDGAIKRKFGVSMQHYSFAVKAFVEMTRSFDTSKYEFAIRETQTQNVIQDVGTQRSEIGILYRDEFNAPIIDKQLARNALAFHPLVTCPAHVYLWKRHPLAKRARIRFEELAPYPCLSFEQGDSNSFYYSEEILSMLDYPRTIKATDRATMLNLMVGVSGYMLCSGIICEELNGSDFVTIPFEGDSEHPNPDMEIGYIVKKNIVLSSMGERYLQELDRYLREIRADRR